MLGALIIVFREIIEAGLIVGIVLAVTQGVRGSRLVIGAGVAAGVAGASSWRPSQACWPRRWRAWARRSSTPRSCSSPS